MSGNLAVMGIVGVVLLLALALMIWNVRLAKRASASEKMNEVLRASQKLQRAAEKVRAHKRRTGNDLLDSLQDRGSGADDS